MSVSQLPILNGPSARPAVDIEGLRAALSRSVAGEVRFDRLSRALYSTDASVYQIVPVGVVVPKTESDILETIKLCAEFHVPLTARGGGTSQAGQSIGPGVVLDCSKSWNAILEIDAAGRRARVQPGCVLDDLNRALKPYGLLFAPDVSTSNRATIGGMIANNSSGARSVYYGKTIDHVLSLKVALADGSTLEAGPLSVDQFQARAHRDDRLGACYRTIARLASECADEVERRFPKILRRVGGYNLDRFLRGDQNGCFNLTHLLVGSEGTLGVTLEATLRLVELPKARAVVVAQFSDLLDSLAATPQILNHRPAAVEVIDRYVLDSTRLNPEAARLRDFLQGDPAAILLIELYGETAGELVPRLETLEADLRRLATFHHLHRATDPGAQARIWSLRKMALGLSMAQKGDAKAISFVEDTAVAPEHLRDYIAEFLEIVARHETKAGVYAHASVGCLHVRPVINLKTEAGVRQFESIAADVADLVLKYGGALSGEHGDGLVRSPFQEKMFGPVLYDAFREIKRTFDPGNILNPGKIVNAPPLATNLRYGTEYVTPAVPTTFDFSADGSVLQAVELCAGVGACRKTGDGTMCPSFRATRDERESTRGRANALRMAITGQMGFQGFTDPALREVLDLCLECKACKSECPTNVDMARLKAEYLHQYQREHGIPRRNRLFGRIGRISLIGSRLAPISNWIARNGLSRRLGEQIVGIDRRRVPPAFARRTWTDRVLAERPSAAATSGPSKHSTRSRVFLFPDTFANYFEPEVAEATYQVLEGAGFQVNCGLAREGGRDQLFCCGRPQISNGLLEEAMALARHNVERLLPWAQAGVRILACEPSCILTLKDDYPALLRGTWRAKADIVSAACCTFEEMFEGQESQPSALNLRGGARRILVQGHCHQRSLVGMNPLLRLLQKIPAAEVVDLDAGCCGMAGSFGYETEHYEISQRVGEHRLFPAIRAAADDTVIVANGFSCRLQVDHFCGRTAIHPAVLLQQLMKSERGA
jgi:FAD/FMN-containing dehydrogenase/Fe-S oxidoreductase